MGDCSLSLMYNGPKCTEKICKYASWCPTCDRNPPRRRRSRSETNELCRRKCKEMKTFTPKKYHTRSQEYENMELDYQYNDYFYYEPDAKEFRTECPRIRANLCELPTTYISNNCQSPGNNCNTMATHLSKGPVVDPQFVSCVQKNVKTYEQTLKFVDEFDNRRESFEMTSDRTRVAPKFADGRDPFKFNTPIRCDLDKKYNNYESLKSPARPLCLPVQKTQTASKSKPQSQQPNGRVQSYNLRPRDIRTDNHHSNLAFAKDHNQGSVDQHQHRLDNQRRGSNDRSLDHNPDCISYDTCTFFDKKIDTHKLREDYQREMEILRTKLTVLKQNGGSPVFKVPCLEPTKATESINVRIIHDVNSQGDGSTKDLPPSNLKTTAIRKRTIMSPPLSKAVKSKLALKTRGKMPSMKVRKARSKANADAKVSDESGTECSASDESEEEPDITESSESISESSNGDSSAKSKDDVTSADIQVQPVGGDAVGWPIRPSLFPNIPPYIRFNSHDSEMPFKLPLGRKHFQWKLSTITPVLVRKTLTNSGFTLVRKSNSWMGTWGKHMKSPCFKTLKETQKLNHFPGTFQLGRKDRLWRNFQRLINKFGPREFGFLPHTYIIPQELRLLKQNWEFKNGAGGEMWIIKPPASARGVGIKVINKWSQLPKKMSLVVQKYISNPYLINGSKFDLRLYVLVTSFNPLRIYLYPEGLARFASSKYSDDAKDLKDRYMHLTNYSINKLSSQYTPNEDADSCQGHKWTISRLFQYMSEERGVDPKALWKSLEQLVIKTIITSEAPIIQLCEENMNCRYNCYELFGVDVLLDEKLKPWLLEVNISPSLHSASPLDAHVKGPMVQTLFDLAQFHLPPRLTRAAAQRAPPCYDPRQYTVALTKRERQKHARFVQSETRDEYVDDILDELTGDDVRHLVQAEDELTVRGRFHRIFPTAQTHRYLHFLDVRYYNRLFDAWETRYECNRKVGIARLQELCAQKVHLKVAAQSKVNKSCPSTNPVSPSIQPSAEGQSCPLAQGMQEVTLSTSTNPSSN